MMSDLGNDEHSTFDFPSLLLPAFFHNNSIRAPRAFFRRGTHLLDSPLPVKYLPLTRFVGEGIRLPLP